MSTCSVVQSYNSTGQVVLTVWQVLAVPTIATSPQSHNRELWHSLPTSHAQGQYPQEVRSCDHVRALLNMCGPHLRMAIKSARVATAKWHNHGTLCPNFHCNPTCNVICPGKQDVWGWQQHPEGRAGHKEVKAVSTTTQWKPCPMYLWHLCLYKKDKTWITQLLLRALGNRPSSGIINLTSSRLEKRQFDAASTSYLWSRADGLQITCNFKRAAVKALFAKSKGFDWNLKSAIHMWWTAIPNICSQRG